MKELLNPKKRHEDLKAKVINSIETSFPVVGKNRTLTIKDVHVKDNTDQFDFAHQKDLKLKGKSLTAPIYGTLQIKENATGKITSERKTKLGDLPVITPRFSYLLNGTEYTVDHQLRLKPGIYTREKDNGEIEARFNLAKGGRNFKLSLDPATNIITIGIRTSNPELYPLLKALDIDDSQIEQAWGKELLAINKKKTARKMTSVLNNIYKAIFGKAPSDQSSIKGDLKDFFSQTQLSEETTKKTLGKSFSSVTPEALLLSSKKLIDVSRGTAPTDNRDSLDFKKVMSVGDLAGAKVRANVRKIGRTIKRQLDRGQPIEKILSKDTFGKPILDTFNQSVLANPSSQLNPLAILSNITKVTSMGEGGISNANTTSNSMRMVDPSQLGILDPMHTPESDRIGIDLHLTTGSAIKNGELGARLVNVKTGAMETLSSKEAFNKKIAFPGELSPTNKNSKVKVMYQNKLEYVDRSEVEYKVPSANSMFGFVTSTIPFLGNTQGSRAGMATKELVQTLPLVHKEAPLIQVKSGKNSTVEKLLGSMFSLHANKDDVVKEVTPNAIKMKSGTQYSLYNNMPLNNKGFLHSEVKVKAGDKVTKGQLLADSNHTSDGVLATGRNLRVAYVPFKDKTFEDGIVISETAAKKLTSAHIREISADIGADDIVNLSKYKARYPMNITASMEKKLDSDGVIRVGQKVDPGDVIITHLRKTEASQEASQLGLLSKKLANNYIDVTKIWDHPFTGVVVDVYKDNRLIKVLIKTEEQTMRGDKLAARYANKGVISAVLPDKEMPMDKNGNHMEILLSPLGVPGRINPSQILEANLAKVADKLGRPLKITNFKNVDSAQEVNKALKENGLSDKEELIDPTTGISMGMISTGKEYISKLDHQVLNKLNARGAGVGYDLNKQPTKGGNASARSLDRLTWNSLIAHGARKNLYEMTNYKGQDNPELWRAVKLGLPLPAVKKTFAFDKFQGLLNASGINVKKEGNSMSLLPLTDEDVMAKSNGEINDAHVVVGKNIRPIADGLFDPNITGGLSGTKWTHINLAEPIPNPAAEQAIVNVLGIKNKEYTGLMNGTVFVDKNNKLTSEKTPEAITGSKAIQKLLSNIDEKTTLKKLKREAKHLSGAKLDKNFKQAKYLRALVDNNMKAKDAYMISKVPVLPPVFRPMFALPNGSLNSSPLNYMYRDAIMVNKQLKEVPKELDDTHRADLRKELYNSVKALQGLGDPIVNRGLSKSKGAMKIIAGDSPKTGFFQKVLFKKRQDLSGSSAITPSSDMNVDEIKLPTNMAWNMYKPFTIKELGTMGYSPLDAEKHIKDKTPQARMALETAVSKRPLWLNRSPSLHKHSILAVQPKLYNGNSIALHPLVVGGFTADFDGDSVLDAVFALVDATKLSKLTFGINFDTLDVESFIQQRSIDVPSISQLSITQGKELIHLNLQDFPIIPESKVEKDRGVIEYDVPEGIEIFTVDSTTHKLITAPVTKFSVHPDLRNYVVETSTNDTLWLSSDHSAITYDSKTGELVKTKPSMLEGKAMPKVKKLEIVPSIFEVPLIDYSTGGTKKYIVKDKVTVDEKLGHFLGMMVGDGWLTSATNRSDIPDTICFANVSPELAKAFKDGITNLVTNEEVVVSKAVNPHLFQGIQSYSERHSVSSKALAQNIKNWIGHTAENKHLPPFYIAAPEEFRLALLSGLLDTDGTIRWSKSKKKPQIVIKYSTISERLAQEVCTLARTLGIRANLKSYSKEFVILFSSIDMHDIKLKLKLPRRAKAFAEFISEPLSEATLKSQATKYDLIPFHEHMFKHYMKALPKACLKRNKDREQFALYSTMRRAIKTGCISKHSMKRIRKYVIDAGLTFPSFVDDLLEDTSITWVYAKKVTLSPKKVTMYDITAPGPYTFMVSSGVIVQDTMGTYVPISDQAVNEAKKFFPSKALFNPGDNSVMLSPGLDIMVGFYFLSKPGKKNLSKHFATKKQAMIAYTKKQIGMNDIVNIGNLQTSLGRYLMLEQLPRGIGLPAEGLSKANMSKWLRQLATKGSETYRDVMSNLTKLATKYNAYSGMTLGVSDLKPQKKVRAHTLNKFMPLFNKAKTVDDRRKLLSEFTPVMNTQVKKNLTIDSHNPLNTMYKHIGKPSFDQYKQLVSTPFTLLDPNGKVVPVPITKSYSEGLSPAEYWFASYSARKGAMDRKLSTAEPGYFSKQVLAVTIDQVISEEDCGTKEGIPISISNNEDIIGRFEAVTNILITEQIYQERVRAKNKTITVRSPLKCLAKHGVCVKCYGLTENGQLPEIGMNVGALAGQTLTQPATQAAMKTHHTGGVLGKSSENVNAFARLKSFFTLPKIIKNKATLSTVNGVVDKIENNPGGGTNVYISGKKHLVSPNVLLKVKKGDMVEKGEAISGGNIKPQEVLDTKGMYSAQRLLVNSLKDLYSGMGKPMSSKIIETGIRATTNLTKIDDPGDNTKYLAGEYAPLQEINHWNNFTMKTIPTDEAVGHTLDENAPPYRKGTVITKAMATDLKRLGHKKLRVKKQKVIHTPQLKGISVLARLGKDWLAKANTDYIQTNLLEGAFTNAKSEISGYNPVGPYVIGTGFGKGTKGKY